MLRLFVLATALALACAAKRATVHVDGSRVQHSVSPMLYGTFFEEINFAGEGGLYAELIRNRDFEALGRGDLGDGRSPSRVPDASDYRPWSVSTVSGQATVATDTTTQPFATNPVVLKITTTGAAKVQLLNPGYWGIRCVTGLQYRGSLYVKSDIDIAVTASLQRSGTLSTAAGLKVLSGNWARQTFSLQGTATDSAALFALVLDIPAAGTVWLDSISLFPGDAVAGLFRKDLFEWFAALRPAFLRFPGGNYLEGNDLETRWDWKRSVADPEARPGHYNVAWDYWTNDGLGLYEYFVLCEQLHAEPLMSIFTGYFLNRTYTPLDQCGPFVQDALDALEYANGSPDATVYGKIRAQQGHAAPFNLKMIEVGNEETLQEEYRAHYDLFTRSVWQASPATTVIASGYVGPWAPPPVGGPCTTGMRCDLWDEHYYQKPDDMASHHNIYDNYNRTGLPPVFVGEYAAESGGKVETLRAGLAEAAFMIGFERNADVVRMASFAPLFRNVYGTQWGYDLINFNSSSIYGMPSYYVQTMFRDAQPSIIYATEFDGVQTATAGATASGAIVLKVVNYSKKSVDVEISLDGFSQVPASGQLTLLTGKSADSKNTLENPRTVYPSSSKVDAGKTMKLSLPAWSLAILSL